MRSTECSPAYHHEWNPEFRSDAASNRCGKGLKGDERHREERNGVGNIIFV